MFELFVILRYLYVGQVLAFSLCILLIAPNDRHKAWWLSSSVLGSIGILLASLNMVLGPETPALGSAATVLSGSFKAIAVGDGNTFSKRNRIPLFLLILSLVSVIALVCVRVEYRLALMMGGGTLVVLATILRLLHSRKWRGLWGRNVLLMTLTFATGTQLYRLSTAYPIGDDLYFAGREAAQLANLLLLTLFSFFMQLGFIGMLSGRAHRIDQFIQRRTLRAHERAVAMAHEKKQADDVSEQRLGMLRMLTHEVRQPLNNAQAALQAVSMELSQAQIRRDVVEAAARKTQDVLDSVVLSLSNAIIASSILERGAGARFCAQELTELCQLAILDCPANLRHRITFDHPADKIFLQCDPVLLRLALRNLLDNALKYSPAGSPVAFAVDVDDERFGVIIRVTNTVADPAYLQGNLFEKGKRGTDKIAGGYGIGLFVVSETARLHFGSLYYYQNASEEVNFEIYLPY